MPERAAAAGPVQGPGHAAAALGGEAPLRVLAACHDRARAECAALRRLAERLARHGADRQARHAAAALAGDFGACVAQHLADEEAGLFPALIESMAGSDAVCLRELTASLAAEHRELERLWRALQPRLERVASAGAAALPHDEVSAFADLCERHMAREDAELLPMAARLLGDAELDRLGLAMRARRGAVEPAGPPPSSLA